ncbi:MAG TPA: glucose-6-phosphate isomerase [Hellea balneolensis]|uniref:Glucose-6-phosphate isomerase n=1 Tax=Hellea balneolensis TaxID=287478 RepID=A0A7C3C9F2_9PROT|nr:glucose-6-phosphate isomerase [Hellea balneolensis]
MADLFADDPQRVSHMSHACTGLHVDFSKQKISPEILDTLLELAEHAKVETWRDRLFAGENINTTENRAVLHPALRGSTTNMAICKHVDDMSARTRAFADRLRQDRSYKAVVHIGIGGSDIGPRLCADALRAKYNPLFDLRFVNNIDGASINDALHGLDPQTTLVIIVSKSFGTQETKINGKAAKAWLGNHAARNMVAVTANPKAAKDFGIVDDHIFAFWEWVGGRFSVWSAVSLSLQITYGPDVFDQFLAGARDMDTHFTTAAPAQNIPILMAMVGIWNRNFLNCDTQAIVPYARRLRKFPAFLQQLGMESNGKSTTRDGEDAGHTCPIIWGDEGTNAQHAFFQFLHQSHTLVPVDFICTLRDDEHHTAHHRILLANCFAQSEALMRGKSLDEVQHELQDAGMSKDDITKLAQHKTFRGNRPSTTIALKRLDARTLGALIALYEHKTFVQSVVWNINAFDQWGVELGKDLATTILDELQGGDTQDHDSSTLALIALAQKATNA